MALHKSILPGTKIRVKSLKAITAGLGQPKEYYINPSLLTLPHITIGGIHDRWDYVARAAIGDILTVILSPRRTQHCNMCRVETSTGIQGEVFWTELRSNCEVLNEQV